METTIKIKETRSETRKDTYSHEGQGNKTDEETEKEQQHGQINTNKVHKRSQTSKQIKFNSRGRQQDYIHRELYK